jgi:hypothetical protein
MSSLNLSIWFPSPAILKLITCPMVNNTTLHSLNPNDGMPDAARPNNPSDILKVFLQVRLDDILYFKWRCYLPKNEFCTILARLTPLVTLQMKSMSKRSRPTEENPDIRSPMKLSYTLEHSSLNQQNTNTSIAKVRGITDPNLACRNW